MYLQRQAVLMYWMIVHGSQYLAAHSEYWTRWTTYEGSAMQFWSKGEAERMAARVGGHLKERL